MNNHDQEWKKARKEAHRATGFLLGIGFRVWVFVGLLTIAGAGVALALKPVALGFERDIFVTSHQYQESVQDALATLREQEAQIRVDIEKAADYPEQQAALRGQLKAVQARIRQKERKIR